jgi:hypothetical protein
MVVSDNFSDDGEWEFFEEVALRDGRIPIAQASRRGLYQNWNSCVERARGKYGYIATSDDTMASDLSREAGGGARGTRRLRPGPLLPHHDRLSRTAADRSSGVLAANHALRGRPRGAAARAARPPRTL